VRIAAIWQDFHQAGISIARLGDILNTPAEPTFNPGRAALPSFRGDVTFDHVTFRYRIDGPEVLHDVHFNVPSGQVLGVVGASGSGKSTLAAGSAPRRRGRVLVGGVDFGMVDPTRLRRQLGVAAGNILFNRTIRENIAGLPIPACRSTGSSTRRSLRERTSSS
jgi:subfamily B ATP-binding cassette protein HlyB/CyaB